MWCYNIGCAKSFDPNENKTDSCRFHPKPPIFHDGRKGWECCNKFSTDFSTCLNMPGCQTGLHNGEKPLELPKPQLESKYDVDVVVVETPRPEPRKVRTSESEAMLLIGVTEMPSLRSALNARRIELSLESTKEGSGITDVINFGTRCNNTGCTESYKGSESNKDICLYHNGEAIFHEGMKYWSCCARKTSEFDSFMTQPGCTSGKHLWFKERKAECRDDWFQTTASLTLTLYVKVPVPETVVVRANGVKLEVAFDFDGGKSSYERMFTLFDVIEPEKTAVKVAGTKVEIIVKKRDLSSWRSLEVQHNGGQ